jgi:hypothetical protein
MQVHDRVRLPDPQKRKNSACQTLKNERIAACPNVRLEQIFESGSFEYRYRIFEHVRVGVANNQKVRVTTGSAL